MKNYGLELEFFVLKDDKIIPAYTKTSNLDGNPVIGELRTKVHNNILDCVFELKKLLYLETEKLKAQGCTLSLTTIQKVDDEFLTGLRKSEDYTNKKEHTTLNELSIYLNGKIGKVLPKGVYKASLQINISDNKDVSYTEYTKVTVDDKYKYESKTATKSYSGIFDYVSIIAKLDEAFKQELIDSQRVKGVYAIKKGELGDRIEYRSLPNNIDLDKLIKILK